MDDLDTITVREKPTPHDVPTALALPLERTSSSNDVESGKTHQHGGRGGACTLESVPRSSNSAHMPFYNDSPPGLDMIPSM